MTEIASKSIRVQDNLAEAQEAARDKLANIEKKTGEDFTRGDQLAAKYPKLVTTVDGQLVIKPNQQVDLTAMYLVDNAGKRPRLVRVLTSDQVNQALRDDEGRNFMQGRSAHINKLLGSDTVIVIDEDGDKMLIPAGRNVKKILKFFLNFSGAGALANMAGAELINAVSKNAIGARLVNFHKKDPRLVRKNIKLLQKLP